MYSYLTFNSDPHSKKQQPTLFVLGLKAGGVIFQFVDEVHDMWHKSAGKVEEGRYYGYHVALNSLYSFPRQQIVTLLNWRLSERPVLVC